MSLVSCALLTPGASSQHHSQYTPGTSAQPPQQYFHISEHKRYIILTPEEHSSLLSFVQSILSKKTELKFGKKVYLGSLSNLPRHKVKEYFTQNNTQKTSRIEQADSLIIDRGSIEKFRDFLTISERNYDLSLYQTYIIESIEDKQKLSPVISTYTNRFNNHDYVSTPNCPFYILTGGKKNPLSSQLSSYLKNLTPQDLYTTSNYWNNNPEIAVYEVIEILRKNPNINILFDEDILPLINNDGIELDPDYMSYLDNMFESKDQENINLALEMLSNVDLEKHSLALALFLNKHMGKFFKGSGLYINQNRSFKSFIKYFEAKKINFTENWKKFSSDLLIYYKNDPQSIEIINSFIIQNINIYLKTIGHVIVSHPIEIQDCTIRLK